MRFNLAELWRYEDENLVRHIGEACRLKKTDEGLCCQQTNADVSRPSAPGMDIKIEQNDAVFCDKVPILMIRDKIGKTEIGWTSASG